MTLTTEDGKPCEGIEQGPFEPIAVIGLGALMPDAEDIDAFWQNILEAKVSIRPLPEGRWPGPIDHFWKDGGPGNHTEGYSYAKIGALVSDAEFDWRRWRQPPGTLPQIDPCQLWAITVSARAIEHAGYDAEVKDIDRTRTGVVFANALGGENRNLSNLRVWLNHTTELAKEHGLPADSVDGFNEAVLQGAPRIDEDTMPGELANVVSGRVANLLDLQGPNHAMDAACASSMAAVLDACRLLQTRQVDVMLAGATDRTMDPATFAKFSAIGALSPTQSCPFDARANGFVMGEGAGVLVLKRLGDAVRDGDEIFSVIRGIGGSSDGRGKGITAPSQRGQIQAIARAYSQAGYAASTVELVEAHGTSTKVGDATELSTLSRLWTGVEGTGNVAVGSIKSQIGHLKAAAGIAGIIKSVMALHHRTIPPSANFQTPNPTVDWSNIPFFVPTSPLDWPRPAAHPRRAGVSAFGFGGTNFHIALEGYEPDYHGPLAEEWNARWTAYSGQSDASAPSIFDGSIPATMTHDELKAVEGGVVLLSANSLEGLQQKLTALSFEGPLFDDDPFGRRLSEALQSASTSFEAKAPFRMALVATSWAEFSKRQSLATKAMLDAEKWGFLQAQGVLITDQPPMPAEAKAVHMYPGQGSQYVGMTADLTQRFTAPSNVWAQADETMVEVLGGETLSGFVLRSSLTKEELKTAEHKLKQTEYTQPAMLTADLAIERTLQAYGHTPDMVAGHSLGEYAALMSSGILDMDGALRAAAARGTEMGAVEIDDKGLMASVTAPYEAVESVLGATEGYVIAANKNSPKMTVIAGETAPVKAAMAAFEEQGYSCVALATSHAFHSKIVAPANEPLRRFLEDLEIRWPNVPITANVDGAFYPMEGSDAKASILEKLAPQMASSVEWTKQIETMYEAGGRLFVEVGPKRALTMFAMQILEGKPHVPIMTNHPKQGGIASFMTAIGALALAGRPPAWPALDSEALQAGFKAGPIEARKPRGTVPSTTSAELESLRIRARPLPGSVSSHAPPPSGQTAPSESDHSSERAIRAYVGDRIARYSGYPASFCHGNVALTAILGLSAQQVQSVAATIASEAATDPEFDGFSATTAGDLERWVKAPPSSWRPTATVSSPAAMMTTPVRTVSALQSASRRDVDPYVVTGISLGLPGMDRVFSEDAFEKLVRGETCISEVSDEYKQRLLDKNIVRLIKGRDGSVNMDQAKVFGDIPQLAGLKGAFDLADEFGIDPKAILAWDISTQLAVAAGLLALRDAGIPLTPVEQIGKGGLRLIRNWQVPQVQRERTGIVFSSCFPGLQMGIKHAKTNGDDGEGRFDRRYLFQTLTMGHSQFAQYTGIRGPNTTINLACASATAAFGVAEDWLDAGRVDRVVIISGDDVTGDDLWEWIAGGFAASGAAATNNVVEETALPFDRRRNGLILGMGAAAFVVERNSEAQRRGVQPIAEFLGSTTANSAYHGTRLDVEHVGQVVNDFITDMERRWGLDRHEMAPNTVFFSHETYTPARGGSAQSEVKALRDTFGASTNKLVIANTKGFTGHPMAVGIEDASMFYGLLTRRIPPIANHQEKDPELGDLNLSTGGDYPEIEFGLRFAAGFGSQIALSLMRRWPLKGERIDGAKLLAWARDLADTEDVVMRILQNKLVAYVNGDDNLHGGVQGEPWPATAAWEGKPSVIESTPEPIEAPVEPEAPTEKAPVPPPSPVTVVSDEAMTSTVIEVVVSHTGYPADFIELDQDLEGELGIDTVKQAEIMAEIRERFALPVDEDFILADHPTLNHMIGYIQRMTGDEHAAPAAAPSAPSLPSPSMSPASEEPVETLHEPPQVVQDAGMTETVVAVVVAHTGYPADFIELDQDLEGELGIDTVKQAEIMAEIRDTFGLPVDEDFVLADHPTLNHMIGYIQRMKGGSSAPAAPATPPAPSLQPPSPTVTNPPPVVQAPTPGSHPDIQGVLVSVVVDHTGYPEDFIEMDQDLEGELGIDTVKQAEIMAEIRDRFNLPVDEDFVLADHPTLNHFTAYIVKMKGGDDAQTALDMQPSTPSSHPTQPQEAGLQPQGTRRWQVEIEACPGVPSPLEVSGTVVVSDDGWGVAEAFCKRMEARGLEAVRIGFESRIRDASRQNENGRTVFRADPEQPEHLAWIAEQIGTTPLAGMVHMAPLKLASETWFEDAYPSSQIAMAAHGWFGLLKELGEKIDRNKPGFVASVTSLDGRHGNIGSRFNAVQCAASGVTKSYAFERPDLRCRALDIHPDFVLDEQEAALLIEADLFGLDGEVEIGLDRDGRRWAMVAFAEDLVEEVAPLTSDDTWLVSGGGSGVTAASIIGVANACRNAGSHFILLGRSTLIEATASWTDWGAEQLEQEKNALRERLVEESETGKVTMVEWNRAWQKFTRSRDVYLTIEAVEASGNHAAYHAVDVTDMSALEALGKSLGRTITGVVHGAGMEDSKLVSDKGYDVFDKVVRVKVDGWRALLSAVVASGATGPKFACCFTSVAGRFGNGGQTDYAAANSVLDAEMARLTASQSCRAVAIGWTGWRDVGMATRGSIEAVFAAAGIETLAVDDGVALFVAEALQGGKRRVLGCGSLGLMDKFSSFREAPLKLPPSMSAAIADPSRFPFVDKVLALEEGQELLTQTTLSTVDHPFLVDHAIEGVPYHPGVMALEMFAQSSLLMLPSTCLAGFEEVTFGLPVKLLKGPMTVRVSAVVERREDGLTWVRCRLVSDLSNSKGEVFGEREHHEALVRLVDKRDDLRPFLQAEIDALPPVGTPPPGELLHPPSFIYERYFHGPRFQSHGGVLRGVGTASEPGIDGRALMRHQLPTTDQFTSEQHGETVLLEALPMLIEAGFQNAGLVAMEVLGFTSLPIGIAWSTMLRVPDVDEVLRLRTVQTESLEDGTTVHDVLVVGEDDGPVLALKGLRLKAMGQVDDGQGFTLDR